MLAEQKTNGKKTLELKKLILRQAAVTRNGAISNVCSQPRSMNREQPGHNKGKRMVLIKNCLSYLDALNGPE